MFESKKEFCDTCTVRIGTLFKSKVELKDGKYCMECSERLRKERGLK